MLEAKLIEGHPENVVVMYREDLDRRLEAARKETDSALLGARWGINQCIERLDGYRRMDFIHNVLEPKRAELTKRGIILHWSHGKGDRYKFRATEMAKWLEENLQQITDGGWPSGGKE